MLWDDRLCLVGFRLVKSIWDMGEAEGRFELTILILYILLLEAKKEKLRSYIEDNEIVIQWNKLHDMHTNYEENIFSEKKTKVWK